jgi:uncharacterized protein (TIRG00374 family)
MRNAWIQRVVALLALAVAVYLFLPLLRDIRAAAALFRDARWAWLAAAIIIHACSFGSLAWFNALALRPFPGRIGFVPLTFVLAAISFVSAALPSAGASGIVLRARLLAKFGYSAEASTFTLLFQLVYLTVGTILVGLFGLGFLLQIGRLGGPGIVLLAAVVLLAGLLVWTGWVLVSRPLRTLAMVQRLIGLWNRLSTRLGLKPVDAPAVESRLAAFKEGLQELRAVPGWKFVAAMSGRILLDVAALGACFALLGRLIRPDILLIGYGLTMIVNSLAILPGGLGLADVSLPVLFNLLGVPGSLALAAGLTYRLLGCWFVRLVGFVSWQVLERSATRGLRKVGLP